MTLVPQARSDDATALHRLHRSAIVAAMIAVVAGGAAWGVLAQPEDHSTAALLIGLGSLAVSRGFCRNDADRRR